MAFQGATTSNECFFCGAGKTISVDETCKDCPAGSYKPDDQSVVTCIACESGFSSPQGSISRYNCNIPFCPTGTYFNPDCPEIINEVDNKLEDVCILCPVGSYQVKFSFAKPVSKMFSKSKRFFKT